MPRISIPWAEEPKSSIVVPGINLPAVCTLAYYSRVGFPFKANLYDYCQQDPTIKWWIVVLNWIVLMTLFYSFYKVIERKPVETKSSDSISS